MGRPFPVKPTAVCVKCNQSLDKSNFPFTLGGSRSRMCSGCRKTPPGHKHCTKCNALCEKAIHFRKLKNGGFASVCRACDAAKPLKVFHCNRCNQDLPDDSFTRWNNNTRNPYCKKCHKPVPTEKRCRECGITKPVIDFGKWRNSTRKPKCIACEQKYLSQRGEKPVEAPNPCVHCGKTFVVTMPRHRREALKYCSPRCVQEAFLAGEKECVLCLKSKPRIQFPQKKHYSGRIAYCEDCAEKKRNNAFRRTATRLSVVSIIRYLKLRARAKKQTVDISAADAQKVVNEPCRMCGTDMYCLIPKDEGLPITIDNVVPCCLECRSMTEKRGYLGTVHWAMLVAEGHGMVKKALAKPPKEKRERVRRMDDNRWVHPLTPSRQEIGETFEQKLKRVTDLHQQRAEALYLARNDKKKYNEMMKDIRREHRDQERARINYRGYNTVRQNLSETE